jgi:hypothetical protein
MIKVPGFIGVRLEELLVFFLVFYCAAIQRVTFKVPFRVSLFVIFVPILLISITVGSFLLMPAALLDLTKYIWLFKATVIYLVFYNYIHADGGSEEKRADEILKLFVICSVLSSFICFQQYFNLFNLNRLYIPLIAPSQYTTLMEGYSSPRVVGMLGNPNSQGYALALALNCMLFLIFKEKSTTKILGAIVIFIAMLMTLSRGSLVSCLAGVLVLFCFYKKDKKFVIYKLVIFCLLFFVLSVLILWLKDNPLIYDLILFRFEALSNISEDTSFVTRFHGWLINIEHFKLSPVFGVGPLPRAVTIFGAADNEWLLFLRSYGIVGVVWLLCFLFVPIFMRRTKFIEAKNRRSLVLAGVIITCLYMIPAGVITSSGLVGILLVFLSIYDSEQVRVYSR